MIIFKTFTFYFAILGILLAIIYSTITGKPPPQAVYLEPPSANPFLRGLAATGIVESVDKNIEIGTPEPGIIDKLWVKVGDKVKKNAPLFRIDVRTLNAQKLVQNADLEVAKATLGKIKDQLNRLRSVKDSRAISVEELQTKENEVRVAEAQVHQAEAALKQTEILINRLTPRSPIDGVVLMVDIREGEYVSNNKGAVILGNLEYLQVRADIDEDNAGRFDFHAAAVAYPKNNTLIAIPLKFSRVEPFVVPKKSLTGATEERVDTRVLQVIYSFTPPKDYPLYVGQQVDVFIERQEPPSAHNESL